MARSGQSGGRPRVKRARECGMSLCTMEVFCHTRERKKEEREEREEEKEESTPCAGESELG